ncbi:hypothetical protein [Sphingomonas sp. 28-62-11]|uniref:hypothetical protein n=1 Tax=Sphingomonas sp. 28-62-11 TaxID=1970432 RepID=UPI0035A8B48E
MWFYDTNGDGKHQPNEQIVGYSDQSGFYSETEWEIRQNFLNWETTLGTLDWIVGNPGAATGWFLDHLDELNRSVDLSGSEMIDWKTGGWHRPGHFESHEGLQHLQ